MSRCAWVQCRFLWGAGARGPRACPQSRSAAVRLGSAFGLAEVRDCFDRVTPEDLERHLSPVHRFGFRWALAEPGGMPGRRRGHVAIESSSDRMSRHGRRWRSRRSLPQCAQCFASEFLWPEVDALLGHSTLDLLKASVLRFVPGGWALQCQVDVEGDEWRVLEGAKAALAAGRCGSQLTEAAFAAEV